MTDISSHAIRMVTADGVVTIRKMNISTLAVTTAVVTTGAMRKLVLNTCVVPTFIGGLTLDHE